MIIHIVIKKQRGYFVCKARSLESGENVLKYVCHSEVSAIDMLYAFMKDWEDRALVRLDDRAGLTGDKNG